MLSIVLASFDWSLRSIATPTIAEDQGSDRRTHLSIGFAAHGNGRKVRSRSGKWLGIDTRFIAPST